MEARASHQMQQQIKTDTISWNTDAA